MPDQQEDLTLYQCPKCSYDGGDYKNGDEGWIDTTSEDCGDACARCGDERDDAFQCERCSRWLAGDYYSAPDCNDTGRGVALCGECRPKGN